MDICVCIVIVLPRAVVCVPLGCALGEYIELHEVVQIQYTLDIHGTTITYTLILYDSIMCGIVCATDIIILLLQDQHEEGVRIRTHAYSLYKHMPQKKDFFV